MNFLIIRSIPILFVAYYYFCLGLRGYDIMEMFDRLLKYYIHTISNRKLLKCQMMRVFKQLCKMRYDTMF